jgi:hypothetical protein
MEQSKRQIWDRRFASYRHGNPFSLRCRVRVQLVCHGDCPRVVRGQRESPLRGRREIQWVWAAISSSVARGVTSLGHHCPAASQSCLLSAPVSVFCPLWTPPVPVASCLFADTVIVPPSPAFDPCSWLRIGRNQLEAVVVGGVMVMCLLPATSCGNERGG